VRRKRAHAAIYLVMYQQQLATVPAVCKQNSQLFADGDLRDQK
jgi:hypothetical protein